MTRSAAPGVTISSAGVRVKTPNDVETMDVDFSHAAEQFKTAAAFIERHFLR